MDNGMVALVLSVVTLIVMAFLLWRRSEPITLEGVITTAEEAVPLARILTEVATTGVQAAEQLAATGKILRSDRLTYALNYIKGWSPALSGLENEKILAAIESAVLVANALRAQAEKTAPPLTP